MSARTAAPASSVRRPRRGRVVALGVALAMAGGVVLAPLSVADERTQKAKIDHDIAVLRSELEDTSAELANAYINLRRTQAMLPGARKDLADAQARLIAAQQHNEEMAQALAVAQANEAKAADALASNARDTQSTSNLLGDLARQTYQQGGMGELSVALDATSPDDFATRVVLVDTVMRLQNSALRRLATMRAEARAQQAHLVAVRQQVAALKVQAQQAVQAAATARDVAAAAKVKLDLLLASQTRFAAQVAAKKVGEAKRLATMQAASRRLQAILVARARAARIAAARAAAARAAAARAAHRSVPPPVYDTGGFLSHPVGGGYGSGFGMRFDPIAQRWQLHAGIDFPVNCGTPVHAAADGVVIMAVPESASGGYGNMLVVDHGMHRGVDLTTTYNHLSSWVRTSGYVHRGDVIAYSGTTGMSTGCHLHFETRQDGTPVNPLLWL